VTLEISFHVSPPSTLLKIEKYTGRDSGAAHQINTIKSRKAKELRASELTWLLRRKDKRIITTSEPAPRLLVLVRKLRN